MFYDIMLWIVASELIKFEIKYTYMYFFGISCTSLTTILSGAVHSSTKYTQICRSRYQTAFSWYQTMDGLQTR